MTGAGEARREPRQARRARVAAPALALVVAGIVASLVLVLTGDDVAVSGARC